MGRKKRQTYSISVVTFSIDHFFGPPRCNIFHFRVPVLDKKPATKYEERKIARQYGFEHLSELPYLLPPEGEIKLECLLQLFHEEFGKKDPVVPRLEPHEVLQTYPWATKPKPSVPMVAKDN